MRLEMRRELARKAFHCLSLVYLAGYSWLGREATLIVLGAWILIEGSVEIARLRRPAFNKFLMEFFGGIHRPAEAGRVSGILWTSLGCWLTILLFGAEPRLVGAAHLYLALGDGAAALAGRAFGRRRFHLAGREKSLEGSLACFTVCLVCGWAAGLPPTAAWAGAVTATAVEAAPVPVDDNLWLPLVSAAVLAAVLGL